MKRESRIVLSSPAFPDQPPMDPAVFPEDIKRFFFVLPHQGGVADDVGEDDGSQSPGRHSDPG
ncbi:MAG: hypothetical protein KFF73_05890 [Cyclobacteriaceae bacterium]|nr:hypothetical protein [Cyclobacteriaceae bacterium]